METVISNEAPKSAVAFFLEAGQAELNARLASPENQESRLQERRVALLFASRAMASDVGGPPAYSSPEEIDANPSTVESPAQLGDADPQMSTLVLPWIAKALSILRSHAGDDTHNVEVNKLLLRSVIRPLSILLRKTDSRSSQELAGAITEIAGRQADQGTDVFRLALDLNVNRYGDAPEVQEAAAALTRWVKQSKDPLPAEWTDYEEWISKQSPRVSVSWRGPYILEGGAQLTDYLGENMVVQGRAALCRCGQSAAKPYCDGSHAVSGFTAVKDPRRVPDKRDVYVGQALTVLDNRGTCAHSGFCTDRLPSVFHLREEPFVTPSGARADEILRAVRRCPSGALGAAIDDKEMREFVDRGRQPMVEISRNGPYRLTGGIEVLDENGVPVERNQGASLEHCSLCRCGSSLNKPFCSGMHWSVNFTDPPPITDHDPTLFEWAGGYPAILDMTTIFYSKHVPSDPLVGPLFAKMAPDHPERVASWLSEVFGGPKYYSERYGGYTRMISQHLDKHLTQEQRSHWAMLMAQSADEAGLPTDPEFRAAFIGYIEWGSRIAVENSTSGAKPPEGMPVPQWWWVCNATPGSRVSAIRSATEEAAPVQEALQPGETPSFAKHIKALFRPMDRASMKFVFDLWAFDDVSKHADAILGRVKAGTMPCDGAWQPERVELFQHWVDGGKKP